MSEPMLGCDECNRSTTGSCWRHPAHYAYQDTRGTQPQTVVTNVGTEVPEIREALVIHPGDKLLVRVDPAAYDPKRVERAKAKLRAKLPEVEVIIVACDQLAVVRP